MHRTTADGSIGNLYVDRNVSIGRAGTLLVAKDRNAIQEELCYIIEQAGLTLSDADTTQLHAAVMALIMQQAAEQTALIQQKMPIGSVGLYTLPTAPPGVVYATGATLSRATYADLWAFVDANSADLVDDANAAKYGTGDGSTTFRLPDWRGAFFRMTGTNGSFTTAAGAGFAGAALLVTQNDQFQAWQAGGTDVTAKYGYLAADGSLTVGVSTGGAGYSIPYFQNTAQGVGGKITAVSNGTNGTPRTGAETRAFNTAINYGILFE